MAKRRGRGEGGIEQLPSGSWRGVVCRTMPDGKRVRASKTLPTKTELLAWMNSARTSPPTAPLTYGDWQRQWLDLHATRVSTAAYRTDRQVCDSLLSAVSLTGTKLRDLTPLRCETFLASLVALSQSQRHKAGRTLRMVCHAAAKSGVVANSPMKGVKVTRPPTPDTVSLTTEEATALIQAADKLGHGPLFRLWLDAGLRPGELLGLQWGDFDPQARTIYVQRSVEINSGKLKEPKTAKSRRKIVLSCGTSAALTPGLPSAPMFPAPRGSHWHNRNFRGRVFDAVAKAAKLRTNPYVLRHTMATLLLRAGISLRTVSERLGHEDVAMTLRVYAHALPGDQERAAEVMQGILPPPHAIPTPPEKVPILNEPGGT